MIERLSKTFFLKSYFSNISVSKNLSKLKLTLFIFPAFLLLSILILLFINNSLTVNNYIDIQKYCFFYLNSKLSAYPNTLFNLTQIGDDFIFLSFLSILFVYTPKVWEALISASLVSAIISFLLKRLFAVPRPAAVFDHNNFIIIGEALTGKTSLPSGHSITVFTLLTVLLFAFMPKQKMKKTCWSILIITSGLLLVFTRVGVGAHYPLDVIIGGIIGYLCGLAGILITAKYKICCWIENKKYFPFFIALFLACSIVLINKIIANNLIIFYLALLFLIYSLIKTINIYVKK